VILVSTMTGVLQLFVAGQSAYKRELVRLRAVSIKVI